MSKRPPKSHIVRAGKTACGRGANGLLASEVLGLINFVLLKAEKRDEIIKRTTCAKCVKCRYNL